MAISQLQSMQYMSDKFVESVGAIVFRHSTKQICLLHLLRTDEYVLAKGRRNCGETRQATALREVFEECGYRCTLLPLDMASRCPPPIEDGQVGDMPRHYVQICEPFAVQIRQLSEVGDDIKLIWWYVAVTEDTDPVQHREDAKKFEVEFFDYGDAINRLTFNADREVVRKAINLVSDTYGRDS